MARYNIGQRVIINVLNSPAFLSSMHGHTCTIKRIESIVECMDDGQGYEVLGDVYILDWSEKDNPGRVCKLPMQGMLWDESELVPIVLLPPLVSYEGLPDV